jgi:hypothetical protein
VGLLIYVILLMRQKTKKYPTVVAFEEDDYFILQHIRKRTEMTMKQVISLSIRACEGMLIQKFSEMKSPRGVDVDDVVAGIESRARP